ncbi:MAG: acylneuraminate cytidylyltransferase family protein [Gemmatimonadota bacterium]
MHAIALICARAGSKGIPGKNLAEIGGRSLIARAVDAAKGVSGIERVIVSTDGEAIASAAREAGAEVPFMRPAELAMDTSPEWLVWRHALRHVEAKTGRLPDALVVVPATAPLRESRDVAACLEVFERERPDVVITVTNARRNPYFNMVQLGADGDARLVMPPAAGVTRRQDAPAMYDMATVAYVAAPAFVLRANGMFEGRVRAVVIPDERAVDIDEPLDLVIARAIHASRSAS